MGPEGLPLSGANMGPQPIVMPLHHLRGSMWSEVRIGTDPSQPLPSYPEWGRGELLTLAGWTDHKSPKTWLWNWLSLALSWGPWPPRQAQASSLSANICSVGPPSGRVGTWWLPGLESTHYEQRIILHSIKHVITARCCGDGHTTTPYNNCNYDPSVSLAQHTLNFLSQKKFGRIAY